jgi:hypothetical protein
MEFVVVSQMPALKYFKMRWFIGNDKKLPQILRMRDILARGIAVHHGGLLPIVKEVCHLTLCIDCSLQKLTRDCISDG